VYVIACCKRYYCVAGVHLASIGDITTKEVNGVDVKQITYSDQIQGRGWYMLFCLFWTTEFITAMGQVSGEFQVHAL
jgi:Plasma-membrane choline transporter